MDVSGNWRIWARYGYEILATLLVEPKSEFLLKCVDYKIEHKEEYL